MCLSVPKDLANRWNDRVLLFRVTSHRSCEGLKLFWERVPPPCQEKSTKFNKIKNINKWGKINLLSYACFYYSLHFRKRMQDPGNKASEGEEKALAKLSNRIQVGWLVDWSVGDYWFYINDDKNTINIIYLNIVAMPQQMYFNMNMYCIILIMYNRMYVC